MDKSDGPIYRPILTYYRNIMYNMKLLTRMPKVCLRSFRKCFQYIILNGEPVYPYVMVIFQM